MGVDECSMGRGEDERDERGGCVRVLPRNSTIGR